MRIDDIISEIGIHLAEEGEHLKRIIVTPAQFNQLKREIVEQCKYPQTIEGPPYGIQDLVIHGVRIVKGP